MGEDGECGDAEPSSCLEPPAGDKLGLGSAICSAGPNFWRSDLGGLLGGVCCFLRSHAVRLHAAGLVDLRESTCADMAPFVMYALHALG